LQRWEKPLTALAGALFASACVLVLGWPSGAGAWFGMLAVVSGAVALAWWRAHPAISLVTAAALFLVATTTELQMASAGLLLGTVIAVLAGERFSGRSAFAAAGGVVVYVLLIYRTTHDTGLGEWVFTVPGFVVGTALRLRRETADALRSRARELEEERGLYTDLVVRNERARIAAELHDIVGHAVSVMVIQAAAGQRLVGSDPNAATRILEVIADSARQGREDLNRLVDLLGGSPVPDPHDLSLVEEVVTSAARSGLDVSCRFEGDRGSISAEAAHATFRVVQEGLTNALRYAPGSAVRVLVRAGSTPTGVLIRVENGPCRQPVEWGLGSGEGLRGLRDRIQTLGGSLVAGATVQGGWAVEATLPT
jgi:signal transduction histidine kinase